MPEVGMTSIPRKPAARGVADMLRISDGRMSGTAGGTIVLHISPESAVPESPFGAVRSGDLIVFDAEKRILRVDIGNEELQARIEQASAGDCRHQSITERTTDKKGILGFVRTDCQPGP